MTVIDTLTPQPVEQQLSGFVRSARGLYYAWTVLFIAGVVLQVFFAGASLLVNSAYLEYHRVFAHILELFAMLLPLLALVARQPWRITLLSLLPFVLIAMQYVFLWALTGMGLPLWTRGLHAVNALVIYWVMLRLSRSAWQLWRAPTR
ncbi:MAG: hypothetical protein IT328_12635 [Caldilineaceae bacterium]|nr:hypothetical protein [Caldilineaceae bacterium]